MHDTAYRFLASQVDAFGLADKSVLEIGSSQENDGGYGGRVRALFTGRYHGIDRVDGPGVDQVADIEDMMEARALWLRGPWDVVLCLEVLEHTPRPWLAIGHMAYIVPDGGSLIITCRGYDKEGYAPVHMEPHDYWRFSTAAVESMIQDAGLRMLTCVPDPHREWRGVLAHAIQP